LKIQVLSDFETCQSVNSYRRFERTWHNHVATEDEVAVFLLNDHNFSTINIP